MLVLQTPQELKNYVGQTLGTSDWLTVDQERIDQFAAATGDQQWIHVDVDRARDEMPGGKTIAHGFLTLSLIPMLTAQIYKIEQKSRGINYGLNKLRFTDMVPVDSRVRLRQSCLKIEDVEPNGVRIFSENVIEIEGSERPACVAESITLAYA